MRKFLKQKNTQEHIPLAVRVIMSSYVTQHLENSTVHSPWENESEKAK